MLCKPQIIVCYTIKINKLKENFTCYLNFKKP